MRVESGDKVSASRTDLKGSGLPHQCAHWFATTPLFLRSRVIFALCESWVPRRNGLPHQCAHWFATTHLFYAAVSFLHCASRGCQGETDCHTSVRTGQLMTHLFYAAVSFIHCASPGAKGKRIATPVCALVRNDTVVLRSRVIYTSCVSWCHRGCGLPHQCAHWFATTPNFYYIRIIFSITISPLSTLLTPNS